MVQYVQIDVEGFDDRIVLGLPFGDRRFLPAAVVFEFVLLGEARVREAIGLLARHGYGMLCCDFQNIVALHNATFAAALREGPMLRTQDRIARKAASRKPGQ